MSEYRVKGRPVGSVCLHCRHRPARPNKRWPHLATGWCSDACRANDQLARHRAEMVELANTIRRMVGLADGRGWTFTRPELAAIERRLRRVLPYGGLAMRRLSTRRSA